MPAIFKTFIVDFMDSASSLRTASEAFALELQNCLPPPNSQIAFSMCQTIGAGEGHPCVAQIGRDLELLPCCSKILAESLSDLVRNLHRYWSTSDKTQQQT